MQWRFPARQRIEALNEKVEAVGRRVDEVMARVDDLVADYGRLSSALDHIRRDLGREAADRRAQSDQLAVLGDAVSGLRNADKAASGALAEVREDHRRASDTVAELRAEGERTVDVIAEQASALGAMQERSGEQGRSLDQIRADVTRIERQAAADLAELRTTNTALARVMLRPDGARRSATPLDDGEAVRREPPSRPLSRRLHETADELAAPEAVPVAVVEEEPAERQATG